MTNTGTLSRRIQDIIAEQLSLPPSKVTSSALLTEQLGANQLDTVEIVVALEQEFGINIPDEDADAFETAAQITDYVSAKISEPEPAAAPAQAKAEACPQPGQSAPKPEASGPARETAAPDAQFLDLINRELSGPMDTIKTHIESIDRHLSAAGFANPVLLEDYFTHIKPGITRLAGFVGDLVEVAKIEHGLLDCKPRPLRIQTVADEALKIFEHEGEMQVVTLSNRIPAEVEQVLGDSGYLRRALGRLISNAIKFTPDGGEVWLQAEPYEENGRAMLRVEVCDTGCGLNANDQKKLFKKFKQGKHVKQRASHQKGSGLGLFIVKELLAAQKSVVEIGPRPGGGTRVFFGLPFFKE
ncbi:MAG: acyl carrier protein [Elusimicrobiota bacterium]|nr:acyl carrier protein [Elusimicrobiota bacterium]